ncbi:hypothetical protein MSG28_014004 [Choristoneura fumiferana]|uniref:Uncharacterized protein n=1 Tax=Choristoneura fumiferana TaxID=7141 RepID=A0ACC0K9R4_CHOFU|nr:hypothetical protein MSG28_014004 [Choristoneura fumiferana]
MDLRIFALIMIEVTALCPSGNKYDEFYNECVPTNPLTILLLQIHHPRVRIKEIIVKNEEEKESTNKDAEMINIAAIEERRNAKLLKSHTEKYPGELKFDEIIQVYNHRPILRYIQHAFKDCALCNLKNTKSSSKLKEPNADESNGMNLVDLFDIPIVVANGQGKSEDALAKIINKIWIR